MQAIIAKVVFFEEVNAVGGGAELLCACADDVGSWCLVRECVDLEEMFGCVVVEKLLQWEDADFRSMNCRNIICPFRIRPF